MTAADEALARIARAIESLAPTLHSEADWRASPAYSWSVDAVRVIPQLDALPLDRLVGIDRHKLAVCENIARHAQGFAAHDMLLWGSRGTGKSALVRAAVHDWQQRDETAGLALLQLDPEGTHDLPRLFDVLRGIERRFLVFIDDLAFDRSEGRSLRMLRSVLDGGIDPRPGNVRLAVTTNLRAMLEREAADQAEPLHGRDRTEDALALADRFGLRLGFHPFDQASYLAIVRAHAAPLEIAIDEEEALAWSRRQGQLSGRSALQFVTELAGRAGKNLRG